MTDASNASGFNAPGGWSWPDDIGSSRHRTNTSSHAQSDTGHSGASTYSSSKDNQEQSRASFQHGAEPQNNNASHKKQKHYKPRTCRICLETVQPTYQPPSESLPLYLAGSMPNITYFSEDGGRLIRPCKCKGSQRYVHEGCLDTWRHADPAYGTRNFWTCPTCHYQYRLERMRWGKWISSSAAQVLLTLTIFLGCVFLIGFVADPIINTYADPLGTIASIPFSEEEVVYDRRYWNDRSRRWEEDDVIGWPEHFLKGFAGLGVLGFMKMMWSLSPFHWLRIGGGGWGGGARVGSTGRDRAASISWVVLIVGICTFLFTVWKAVRALSRRFLQRAGERVMDVPLSPGETEDADDDE